MVRKLRSPSRFWARMLHVGGGDPLARPCSSTGSCATGGAGGRWMASRSVLARVCAGFFAIGMLAGTVGIVGRERRPQPERRQ